MSLTNCYGLEKNEKNSSNDLQLTLNDPQTPLHGYFVYPTMEIQIRLKKLYFVALLYRRGRLLSTI